MAKLSVLVVAAFATLFSCESAQADNGFGFPFGYGLGYQYSFRNRLPTPPYFSIYPPVYYGTRYYRPYGDSPYAAWPQMGTAPDYVPTTRNAPVIHRRTVMNPYVGEEYQAQGNVREIEMGVAAAEAPRGQARIIINPYAQEQVAEKK